METRRIGQLDVTVVGIGCNNFGMRIDADATAAVVYAALDAGVNFFDTADIYGGRGKSEEFLGAALSKRSRDQVVIATKFGMPMSDDEKDGRRGASPAWAKRAVDDSLRRLGTDWIDLYQLHAPDATVPIEDTLGALNELVQAGKVREIGCSNFTNAMVDDAAGVAARTGGAQFRSLQNQWSLLERGVEADALPACERHGVVVLPYFPLASGLLTGKYRTGQPAPEGTRLAAWGSRGTKMLSEEYMAPVEKLDAFARSRERTLLELAMSWLASHGSVASVIAGATSPEQVKANVAATTWRLDADEMAAVDEIVPPPAPATNED
jgi:aryl-alcohol dehydrogenase-like predicted oxidoreductase